MPDRLALPSVMGYVVTAREFNTPPRTSKFPPTLLHLPSALLMQSSRDPFALRQPPLRLPLVLIPSGRLAIPLNLYKRPSSGEPSYRLSFRQQLPGKTPLGHVVMAIWHASTTTLCLVRLLKIVSMIDQRALPMALLSLPPQCAPSFD